MSENVGDEGQKRVYDAWYTAAAIVGILGSASWPSGTIPSVSPSVGSRFLSCASAKWAGRRIDNQ